MNNQGNCAEDAETAINAAAEQGYKDADSMCVHIIKELKNNIEMLKANITTILATEHERTEATIKVERELERKNCAAICRGLYDDWIQEHGAETAYDSGRVTALYNAENAIRARGEE